MANVMNIRDVPTDLLRLAKATAAMQGITLREFVIKALEVRLNFGKKKETQFSKQ
jgi:hypothetical protein